MPGESGDLVHCSFQAQLGDPFTLFSGDLQPVRHEVQARTRSRRQGRDVAGRVYYEDQNILQQ